MSKLTAKQQAYAKIKQAIISKSLKSNIKCLDDANNQLDIHSNDDYSDTVTHFECVGCKYRPYSKTNPNGNDKTVTFQTDPSKYTRVFIEHCQGPKSSKNGHWHKCHWRFKDAVTLETETDCVQPITSMFSSKNKSKPSVSIVDIKSRLRQEKTNFKPQKSSTSRHSQLRFCYGQRGTKYYQLKDDKFQVSPKYEFMLQQKYDDIKEGNFNFKKWNAEFTQLSRADKTFEKKLIKSTLYLPPQYTLQQSKNDDNSVYLKSRLCIGSTMNKNGICNVCMFTAHSSSPVAQSLNSKLARIATDIKKGVTNYRQKSARELKHSQTNRKHYSNVQEGKRAGFDEGVDFASMTVDQLKEQIESQLPDLCHKLGQAMLSGDLTATKFPVLMSF